MQVEETPCLTINVNRYDKMDCFEMVIASILAYYELPITYIFTNSWNFHYNPDLEIWKSFSSSAGSYFFEVMKNIYGTKIRYHETGNMGILLDLCNQEFQNLRPIIMHIDAFNLPWNRAYGRYHYPHYVLITGASTDKLVCKDPYSSNETKFLYIQEDSFPVLCYTIESKPWFDETVVRNTIRKYNCLRICSDGALILMHDFISRLKTCKTAIPFQEHESYFIDLVRIRDERSNFVDMLLTLDNKAFKDAVLYLERSYNHWNTVKTYLIKSSINGMIPVITINKLIDILQRIHEDETIAQKIISTEL